MKLIALSLVIFVTGCASSRFESELMSKYPMEKWRSAEHQGDEYNYDQADVWVEPKQGDVYPSRSGRVFLPYTPDVIHAFPGRYFYFKKDGEWLQYRFNDELDDIEKLTDTDYTRMFTWGNNNSIVGGVKKNGTLDIISTFNGKVVVNLKDANTTDPVAVARHAVFVRMKDGTFKNIRAVLKPAYKAEDVRDEYPAQFIVASETYYFGGEVQNISFGLREVDGMGIVDIFFRGAVKDLSKNEADAKSFGNVAYVKELMPYTNLDFGANPEGRFVILRDGEVTPPRYKELDNDKVKDLIWMRAQSGVPRALGIMMPNEKGEPRIHLLKFWDYRGADARRLKQGTLEISKHGMKDALASYRIHTVNFIEQPVVVGLFDNGKWDHMTGDLRRNYEASTGILVIPSQKATFDSLSLALKDVREGCASFKMSAQEIAKAKSDYEARMYRDGVRARESYDQAIKQIEFRKKMAEYEASQQASREFSEAMGSITGSLTRGATSNTPQGPRGFDDRYDSTGAGWNRYQKWVEKEAKRKAQPGQR